MALKLSLRSGRTAADDPSRAQVVGLCRFSFVSNGGFQYRFDSPDEATRALFRDHRITRRLEMFERMLVPSLAAQTDPDFTLVILTSDRLPTPYLERLRAAVAPLPRCLIVQEPPAPHWRATRDALHRGLTRDDGWIFYFRIDDDDALAVDYVARVRAHAPFLAGIMDHADSPLAALDFTHGVQAVWDDTRCVALYENRRLHSSQGMGTLVKGRSRLTVMTHPHHKSWHKLPMLTLPEPVMYLQSSHPLQDSGRSFTPAGDRHAEPEARALLDERFGIDIDWLRRPLGAPATECPGVKGDCL